MRMLLLFLAFVFLGLPGPSLASFFHFFIIIYVTKDKLIVPIFHWLLLPASKGPRSACWQACQNIDSDF